MRSGIYTKTNSHNPTGHALEYWQQSWRALAGERFFALVIVDDGPSAAGAGGEGRFTDFPLLAGSRLI